MFKKKIENVRFLSFVYISFFLLALLEFVIITVMFNLQDMNSYADSLMDLSKGRAAQFPFAVTDRVIIKVFLSGPSLYALKSMYGSLRS